MNNAYYIPCDCYIVFSKARHWEKNISPRYINAVKNSIH